MKLFENKVAIVTDGDSGIGKVTALELVSQGVSIVIANRNTELI